MNLRFVKALNRSRLRRRVAIERARLAELRETAKEVIKAQERRVETAQSKYDDAVDVSSRAIARRSELRAKAGLLA